MQTNFQQLTPNATPENGQPSQVIREGSVLKATVSAANEDGSYTLKSGSLKISVQSETPLRTGQQLNLLATRNPQGKLTLQVLPDVAQSTADLEQTAQITKSLGFSFDSSDTEKVSKAIGSMQEEKTASQSAPLSTQSVEEVSAKGVKQSNFTLSAPDAPVQSKSAASSQVVDTQAQITINPRTSKVNLVLPGGETIQTQMTLNEFSQANHVTPDVVNDIIQSGSTVSLKSVNFSLQAFTAEGQTIELSLNTKLTEFPKLIEFIELALNSKEAISMQQADDGNITLTLPSGRSMSIPAQALPAGFELETPFVILEPQSLHFDQGFELSGTIDTTVRMSSPSSNQSNTLLADSLLQSAGLTPSLATREAALALIDSGLPVSRQNVQTMLSIAAGYNEQTRPETLGAAAKLLQLDAPVSPVLVKGTQINSTPTNPVSTLLSSAVDNLQQMLAATSDSLPAQTGENLTQTIQSLQNLSVLIGEDTTAAELQKFTMQLGRELLANAAQTIENSAAMVLNQSAEMKIIDAVLDVILSDLSNLDTGTEETVAQKPSGPATQRTTSSAFTVSTTATEKAVESAAPQPSPSNPPITGDTANVINSPNAQPETPTVQISAGAQAEAPVPASENAQNTPLAPTGHQNSETAPATSLNTPEVTDIPAKDSILAEISQAVQSEDTSQKNVPVLSQTEAATNTINTTSTTFQPGDMRQMLRAILQNASTLAAHPGVDEFSPQLLEMLRQDAIPPIFDRAAAENAMRQIFNATSPQQATDIARNLVQTLDQSTLREIAHTLQLVEKEEAESLPGMKNLRQASDSIRDLGRSFIAQKAQNLSTMRMDPAIVAAHIPLRFGNSTGDGNLQMFYRKGQGKGRKDWQQRIMLELNMSALGNIVGDLRFYNGQLNVTLLSNEENSIKFLQSGAKELAQGLDDAGFPCSPGFKLVKKEKKKQVAKAAPNTHNGRLDIKA